MNRAQKIARFNLIVLLVALALSATAISVAYFIIGLPMQRALGGLGFLGICGLIGLSPILFRKKRGEISFDERDLLIYNRASLVAYSVFWLVFTAACMIPWSIIGPSGSISVNVLPIINFGVFLIVMLIYSVAILAQYNWGIKEKNHE